MLYMIRLGSISFIQLLHGTEFIFCPLTYPATAWAVSVPTSHHSLGQDWIRSTVVSRKRMVVESWSRRHSKNLDKMLPNHFRKVEIEVTCQVKVSSKVKIVCGQVADRRDLKRSIFTQHLPYMLPKTSRRYCRMK